MPFTFKVERTVNGKPGTVSFRNVPDDERAWHEDLIGKFRSGQLHSEHVFTVTAGGAGPENPEWTRSWRWADIKDIWIEDAR